VTCEHRFDVFVEQRWRWRIYIQCRHCDERQVHSGRWWRRRHAEEALARVMARLDASAPRPPVDDEPVLSDGLERDRSKEQGGSGG
jgi:hypothetical protein